MNFSLDLVSPTWLWIAWVCYGCAVLAALWRADWQRLFHSADANIWFAACIVLWLTWRMSANLNNAPGLEFHLLLVTSVTLMFGWPFAVLAVSVAQLVLSLEGLAAWDSFAIDLLCHGLLPIAVSFMIFRIVDSKLPRNFFIFIFLCAFLGGAVSMVLTRLLGISILVSSSADYTWTGLFDTQVMMLPIMMFPEAFLNGTVMTMLIVFRPQWVSSFTDERYIQGK